jgi:hypothetical protein
MGVAGFLLSQMSSAGAWAVVQRAGLGQCRVAAFCACARFLFSDFFSTVSHCPWRDFISFSDGEKETEAKKTPLNRKLLGVQSVQFPTVWYFRKTLDAAITNTWTPSPPNSYIHTLRHP